MGDVVEFDKIKSIFANYENLSEAVNTLGLGIIGTSGTHYKIAFMNQKGVVGMKKEKSYDLSGNTINGIRIRVITWAVQMEKQETDDYSKLEEIEWEPKENHHVSLVVKDEAELNKRVQEATDWLEE